MRIFLKIRYKGRLGFTNTGSRKQENSEEDGRGERKKLVLDVVL